MKKTVFTFLFAIVLKVGFTQIQHELVCSSGDSFVGGAYIIDWSVGELATETYENSQYIINQGFHQGHELSVGLVNKTMNNIYLSVFPSPTNGFLTIRQHSKMVGSSESTYILTDISGKVYSADILLDTETTIDLTNYASGVYFISISVKNEKLKTIKIIKN